MTYCYKNKGSIRGIILDSDNNLRKTTILSCQLYIILRYIEN